MMEKKRGTEKLKLRSYNDKNKKTSYISICTIIGVAGCNKSNAAVK
jgi:hypothetical protein